MNALDRPLYRGVKGQNDVIKSPGELGVELGTDSSTEYDVKDSG